MGWEIGRGEMAVEEDQGCFKPIRASLQGHWDAGKGMSTAPNTGH